MIRDYEKFFIKRYLVLLFYRRTFKLNADVRCRSWLRSLRDGCLLAKYPEMVRSIHLSFFLFFLLIIEGDHLVSAMKKKLEKEAMEQEIDE